MKKSLLALTLLAATPFMASAADGISYNYVEGGYIATETDSNLDADGWAINGSGAIAPNFHVFGGYRSEEHTSDLQSLMRISYAVFSLKKKQHKTNIHKTHH